MCEALMELMQDELEASENKGARNKLLEQISKKLAKGKTIEEIADELEESPETIKDLMVELQ